MSVLETFQARFNERKASLVADGLQPGFGYGPADYDPRAAWFDLDSEHRVGRLTVWDDGAAELTVGHIKAGEIIVSEHRDIATSLGLDDAVESLIAWVSDG
jgi:hypothetical protein